MHLWKLKTASLIELFMIIGNLNPWNEASCCYDRDYLEQRLMIAKVFLIIIEEDALKRLENREDHLMLPSIRSQISALDTQL